MGHVSILSIRHETAERTKAEVGLQETGTDRHAGSGCFTDWQIQTHLFISMILDSDNIMQLIGQRNCPNDQKAACKAEDFWSSLALPSVLLQSKRCKCFQLHCWLGTPERISQGTVSLRGKSSQTSHNQASCVKISLSPCSQIWGKAGLLDTTTSWQSENLHVRARTHLRAW